MKAYAGLWKLWLAARTASDAGVKPETTKARVQKLARAIQPATAQQRALLALYQGKTDVSAVFAEIDTLQAPDAVKRDLRTEAGLFAGAISITSARTTPLRCALTSEPFSSPALRQWSAPC